MSPQPKEKGTKERRSALRKGILKVGIIEQVSARHSPAPWLGIELLTEEQYREVQKLGEFDTKPSNCVKTSVDIRKLGGALFCDRRFGHVFTYHNGAQSYYGTRAFRGLLRV